MQATLTPPARKTMTLDEVRTVLRALAPKLAQNYTLRVDGIFGSYARGEQTPESDIDLLVSFERVPGLWHLVGMEYELGDALGIKVQMVHNDGCEFVRRILPGVVPP